MRKTITDYKKDIEDLKAQNSMLEKENIKLSEEYNRMMQSSQIDAQRMARLSNRIEAFEAFVEGLEFALGRKAEGPAIDFARSIIK